MKNALLPGSDDVDGFSGGVLDSGWDAGVSGDNGAGSVLIGTVIGVADTFVQSSLFGGETSGDVFIVTPILPDSFDSTSTFRFVVIAIVDAVVVGVIKPENVFDAFLLLALDWLSGWSSLLLEFVSVKLSANVVDAEPIRNVVFFIWFDAVSPFAWYACLFAFDSLFCFDNVCTLIVGTADVELSFFVLYVRSFSDAFEMLLLALLYVS